MTSCAASLTTRSGSGCREVWRLWAVAGLLSAATVSDVEELRSFSCRDGIGDNHAAWALVVRVELQTLSAFGGGCPGGHKTQYEPDEAPASRRAGGSRA